VPFKGLSAFPITPADDDGIIDTSALGRLVARLAAAGVHSISVLGSTGSAPYFTQSQRRRAIEAAVEAAGHVPVIAGIGALRTSEAIRLGRDAAAAGATAVLLAPVSYTPLTEAEVYHHVLAVVDAIDLPLCIYNNPGTTQFTFSPALVSRLSGAARIQAVKNPAPPADAVGGALATLRGLVPNGFSLGYSVDWHAAEALLAGADAWYSVLAGTLPALCLPIVQAAAGGDAARTRALNARLAPVWALFRQHTSIRVIYAMVNLLGLGPATPPRPILPLAAEAQRDIAAALETLGISL
jgi:4-hydroxy-tetrahydrodipicolinate synthase